MSRRTGLTSKVRAPFTEKGVSPEKVFVNTPSWEKKQLRVKGDSYVKCSTVLSSFNPRIMRHNERQPQGISRDRCRGLSRRWASIKPLDHPGSPMAGPKSLSTSVFHWAASKGDLPCFPLKLTTEQGFPRSNKYLKGPDNKHMHEGGCVGAQRNWRAYNLSKGGATTHSICLLTFRNTDPVLELIQCCKKTRNLHFTWNFQFLCGGAQFEIKCF